MAYNHDRQEKALETQFKRTRIGRNCLRINLFYSYIAQETSKCLEHFDAIVWREEASGVKKNEKCCVIIRSAFPTLHLSHCFMFAFLHILPRYILRNLIKG
jgi:hypothetical protein